MSDDLISRRAALSACHNWDDGKNYYAYGDTVEERLQKLPSAQPDRKKGKWIINISDYKSTCSVCGADETEFIHGTEMWYGKGKSKFCPNCGARMEGEKDE